MTVGVEDIQIRYIHNSIAMVTHMPPDGSLDSLRAQVIELCQFGHDDQFTIKWIDEEQDPCVISSEMELKEAIRLHVLNKECQLTMLVFKGIPSGPGKPCPNEDVNMYRRGAKRWKKKYYLLLGHKFAARRFNKNAQCAYCNGRIWGLGQAGLKCIGCRLLLHRRCLTFVRHKCGESEDAPISQNAYTGSVTTAGEINSPSAPDRNTPDLAQYAKYLDEPHVVSKAACDQARRSGPMTITCIDKRKPHPPTDPRSEAPKDRILTIQPNRLEEMPVVPITGSHVGLQDFTLLKVIGRGSYAKVFQVEHIPTRRIYAMKVIKKETILDEEDIEWVQTEKHVFECATNHPFLVGLHSCFQTDSRLFFVIEFVNGGDLMFYMQRNLRLPEDYARFYSAEICLALNFLHERGIIYRDLKLDNVLMDCEGHIKLTDYGMCKEGISADVMTSTFCGTPNYIAPEILKGENYNFSVDWWALGVLMFEMLAGRSPWEGIGQSANPDQNTEDYLFQVVLTRPIRFPRSISVRATNVLRAFLTKNPTERLGCLPDSNFADIMNHSFFKPIDWVALEQKQVTPPYRPAYSNDYDLAHFDPTFTNEPVVFTPDNEDVIAKIDQTEFEGFEYVNPLLMSLEEPV